ncbi:unnamed protein product [Effrenium voratum]|nr:unnamed protein product [Effrenium voratum]
MSGVSNHSVWWLHVPIPNQDFGQVASTYDCVDLRSFKVEAFALSISHQAVAPELSWQSYGPNFVTGAWAAEFSGGVELRPWGAAAADLCVVQEDPWPASVSKVSFYADGSVVVEEAAG